MGVPLSCRAVPKSNGDIVVHERHPIPTLEETSQAMVFSNSIYNGITTIN